MTDKTPFGVEHIKPHCLDIKYPPRIDRDTLLWGWRLNRVSMVSSHNYRWPFPGHWAKATGPIVDHDGECCSAIGDGICAAHTIAGAQSATAGFGHHVGLLVAWTAPDVLGESTDKVRLRRAWVADTFDPLTVFAAAVRYANLGSANLGSANLRYADLRSANLGSADLRYANLGSANLRYADLRSANLGSANLGSANLRSADLRSANLRSANLGSANLGSADLRYADLRSANLRSADLGSANLRYADLRSANLGSANLGSANLGSANLRSADLRSANLRSADLRSADLGSAKYTQLTLWPTGFDPKKAGAVEVAE